MNELTSEIESKGNEWGTEIGNSNNGEGGELTLTWLNSVSAVREQNLSRWLHFRTRSYSVIFFSKKKLI